MPTSLPLHDDPVPQHEPISQPQTERVDLWDAIHRCWQKLPPREHEVFRMRYLEGLDLRAIADALASNANAVAQNVFRLSRRMRACLRLAGLEEEFA
jgi:RNA polymerase sigma factor (sigma-70 family)